MPNLRDRVLAIAREELQLAFERFLVRAPMNAPPLLIAQANTVALTEMLGSTVEMGTGYFRLRVGDVPADDLMPEVNRLRQQKQILELVNE